MIMLLLLFFDVAICVAVVMRDASNYYILPAEGPAITEIHIYCSYSYKMIAQAIAISYRNSY